MHKVGLRACFGGIYASENHNKGPEGVLKTKKSDKKPRQSTYLDEYLHLQKHIVVKFFFSKIPKKSKFLVILIFFSKHFKISDFFQKIKISDVFFSKIWNFSKTTKKFRCFEKNRIFQNNSKKTRSSIGGASAQIWTQGVT